MPRRALVTAGLAVVSLLLAVPMAGAEPAEDPAVCTGDAPVAPAPGGDDGLCARPAATAGEGTAGAPSPTGSRTGRVVGTAMVAGGLVAAGVTLVLRGPWRRTRAEDIGAESISPTPPGTETVPPAG